MITVFRKEHFNAAHRLHNSNLSDEENETIYGKCNNEYYHGHNYELEVGVRGENDPVTGYVIDMKILSNLIKTHVLEPFDHKNLNEQVDEFKTLIPTAENIAVVIYNKLRPHIDSSKELLITLYETPRNYVTYAG
ncbi:MAG: 6-carboxytetrahydropterin synthase [Flavobacteriaceae bacterium]|jgi:6-pyruvoyltetrahydropterin/6-carboxytetrahydropterin synthase|nr:6-carboxytetrahydropterin synthase [Flavobacteriaceae bacterium]